MFRLEKFIKIFIELLNVGFNNRLCRLENIILSLFNKLSIYCIILSSSWRIRLLHSLSFPYNLVSFPLFLDFSGSLYCSCLHWHLLHSHQFGCIWDFLLPSIRLLFKGFCYHICYPLCSVWQHIKQPLNLSSYDILYNYSILTV